jgi:hypothetical protein
LIHISMPPDLATSIARSRRLRSLRTASFLYDSKALIEITCFKRINKHLDELGQFPRLSRRYLADRDRSCDRSHRARRILVSLVLYCRAVLILGASGGSAFGRWCQRYRPCLPYLSWANGRQHQVGWASFHIGRCVPGKRGPAAGKASRIIDDGQKSHNDRHPESFRFLSL